MMTEQTAPASTNSKPATETTGLLFSSNGNHDQDPLSREKYEDTLVIEEQGPRKSCLYKIFMVISAFAALTSGLTLITLIASFIVLQGVFVQSVLRLYVIVLCVMFILSELQVAFFFKWVPSFENWFHRGFMYTLAGVIVMEESFAAIGTLYPNLPSSVELSEFLLLRVFAGAMFAIGIIYMLMGILRLKRVWEDLQTKYRIECEQSEATTLDV